ncbi:MAG TPA: gamma-glutamyltransferase [Dehalococcoidia bacterium]|nr:gamma-glutamyltransferase [Dehalococcoidia bacterium]
MTQRDGRARRSSGSEEVMMPGVSDRAPDRGPVLATSGMVASEHPLVAQTGVDVLRRGGNAFDAALAMSALLPVVKPHRNHLGGDAYILAYPARDGRVTAICSGGRAPAAATLERYAGGIPAHGGAAVAVPGLVDAWEELHARWCTLPREELLRPAIRYARGGFPVSRELALTFQLSRGLFAKYETMARELYADGGPPAFGAIYRQPALADVLDGIAREGRRAFYEGAVAERIARGVRDAGGCMTEDDLASHRAEVLEPLSAGYRGHTVYETPPNSQGLILLEELNIVEGYDLAGWGHLSADAVHHQVEAKKAAFEDRQRFAGDPAFTEFEPARLLTKEWAAGRRASIDRGRARRTAAPMTSSDTTSFVVVDGAGNACSFIQSLYANFGAAVAIEGTGIIMNNRMTGFSLEPSHPNVLAPGKRTMHTLNSYMVFRDGRPYLIGNTPGGDYQVQTNLQVISGVIDFGLDPQAAIDAPRWGDGPGGLLVEEEMPAATQRELAGRGHDVKPVPRTTAPMGRAQAIIIDPETGVLIGGSDARGEGGAAGW